MIVGTWNLENLMLPRSGDGAPRTEAEYEAKVEALASVITALDPALLGVQEVRQEETLADLAKAAGGQWHTALSRHADRRGIRVGFLSRTPLRIRRDTHVFAELLRPVQGDDGTEPDAHDRETSRGFLAVETDTADGVLHVAVAHLKSKLLSYPGTGAASSRTTRPNGPATAPTPSIGGRPRRRPCARSRTSCSKAPGRNGT